MLKKHKKSAPLREALFFAPICVAIVLLVSFFNRFFKTNFEGMSDGAIEEFVAVRNTSLIILAVLIVLAVIWMVVAKSKAKAS